MSSRRHSAWWGPRRRLGFDAPLVGRRRAIAVAAEAGGAALAIDAKDERAARWYERFGAPRSLDDPLRLILPPPTIALAMREDRV